MIYDPDATEEYDSRFLEQDSQPPGQALIEHLVVGLLVFILGIPSG